MSRKMSTPRKVTCVLCGKDFLTRHSQGKYCSKDCRLEGERSSWREYGRKNASKRKEYHQSYYDRNKESIIKRTAEYAKTENGKNSSRNSHFRQSYMSPEKIFARYVVHAAVMAGYIIKKPCKKCGEKKVHAHHSDYMEPFDIVWLCSKHHSELHTAERRNNNTNKGERV